MKARTREVARGATGALIGLLLFVGQATAVPLSLTGSLTNAGASYTIPQLQALGSTPVTVGGVNYVGVPLWQLLGGTSTGTSNVVTSGGGNNPILRNYLLGVGSDGSRSLVSIGEINPLFGGAGTPYIVAYQANGTTLAEPTLVISRDPTGTRNIDDLIELEVLGVPRPPIGPGGSSTQLSLTGVAHTATYDLAGLQSLPATTVQNVTFLSGTTPNGPHDYTGVAFWSLLEAAGIHDPLTSYVLATGSDGFQVLYALAELDPAFGAPPDLIAYAVDGAGLGTAGFARVVVPGDVRGGRYVSNLVNIEVAQVDEPSVLALLAIPLVLLAGRRKARAVAV